MSRRSSTYASALCRKAPRFWARKATLNVGVSTFIPKPHTPFQWVQQDTREGVDAKLALLKQQLRRGGMHLRWNNYDDSEFEGWVSRGDRRLGRVIRRAWELGCKFDAWQDQHWHRKWLQAFDECHLDPGILQSSRTRSG